MQIPQMTPPGKFMAIDPKDRTSPLAKSFSGTADQMDPLKGIKTMESAVQSAERVGKQTLGGVTVEHYKLTVDTSALVKKMDPAVAKQAELPDTMTYDLWLDEQHLIRRTSFEMAGVNFEATMSRWGKPVKIERPAADAILIAAQGQGLASALLRVRSVRRTPAVNRDHCAVDEPGLWSRAGMRSPPRRRRAGRCGRPGADARPRPPPRPHAPGRQRGTPRSAPS